MTDWLRRSGWLFPRLVGCVLHSAAETVAWHRSAIRLCSMIRQVGHNVGDNNMSQYVAHKSIAWLGCIQFFLIKLLDCQDWTYTTVLSCLLYYAILFTRIYLTCFVVSIAFQRAEPTALDWEWPMQKGSVGCGTSEAIRGNPWQSM